MSASSRRWERSVASIEELIRAVRRESADALNTAEAFLPDARRHQRLDLPHRFPLPDRLPAGPDRGPRDHAAGSPGRGSAEPDGR